jgi:hypothetical protein
VVKLSYYGAFLEGSYSDRVKRRSDVRPAAGPTWRRWAGRGFSFVLTSADGTSLLEIDDDIHRLDRLFFRKDKEKIVHVIDPFFSLFRKCSCFMA